MADLLIMLAEAAGEHGAEKIEPTAFGLNPTWWVAASMLVLMLFAVFGAKVHKIIGSGLDGSIAEIRRQLDEARGLRAEAEALRQEYADKIASAEKDAEAMLAHARSEADAIVAKAEADTGDVIARREKMATDKIAAAERAAVDELRAKAADAATRAARGLIRGNHSAAADKALIDEAISSI
jgi:F-type H+-transporting ATPase subunit b